MSNEAPPSKPADAEQESGKGLDETICSPSSSDRDYATDVCITLRCELEEAQKEVAECRAALNLYRELTPSDHVGASYAALHKKREKDAMRQRRERYLICGTCNVVAMGATAMVCERESCPGKSPENAAVSRGDRERQSESSPNDL